MKRLLVLTAILVLIGLLPAAQPVAADGFCPANNPSGCWARWYTDGDPPPGEPALTFYRIYRACKDGIRIGIASNGKNSETIYVTQFGAGQNPQFRQLIDNTDILLQSFPAGLTIEAASETGSGNTQTFTVYYLKIISLGWKTPPSAAYGDNLQLQTPSVIGNIVQNRDMEDCNIFGSFAAFPPDQQPLQPFAQCFAINQGELTVVFGYTNNTRFDAIIPHGRYNWVTAGFFRLRQPQPTYFEPGRHFNAFRVSVPYYGWNPAVWKLGGLLAALTPSTPRCTS
jgi:hypothetical protein